jgi:hypothetical protein
MFSRLSGKSLHPRRTFARRRRETLLFKLVSFKLKVNKVETPFHTITSFSDSRTNELILKNKLGEQGSEFVFSVQ